MPYCLLGSEREKNGKRKEHGEEGVEEEKGKEKKTKGIGGKKGKLERHVTCHQVPQSIFSQKWPLRHAKLFWAWGTNRKYFQEEFSFQS